MRPTGLWFDHSYQSAAYSLLTLRATVGLAKRLGCVLVALILAIGASLSMASIAQAQALSKEGPVLLAKGGGGGGGGGAGGAGGGAGGAGAGGTGAGGAAGGAAGAGSGAAGGAAGAGGSAAGAGGSAAGAGGSAAGAGGSAAGAGGSAAGAGGSAAGAGGAAGSAGSGGGGAGGGDGATWGVAAPALPTADVVLAKAQQDLAQGDFKGALAGAEKVAQSDVPASLRASALLVAADAAYGLRDYARASGHYTAFLARHRTLPDAPRAAMALGWARFRDRDPGRAQWTWSYVGHEFANDSRAPIALILAARAAQNAGDPGSAQAALDRMLATYPRSPYVGAARLQRSLLALQRGDEKTAVRELGEVIHTSGTPVVQDYAALAAALAKPGAEAGLEAASPRPPVREDSLDRFATAITDTREAQTTPPLLHGVALVAASERGWTDPLVDSLANRLVDEFPSYGAAAALLTRVAAAAAAASRWQVAARDYDKVVARYGDAPAGQR